MKAIRLIALALIVMAGAQKIQAQEVFNIILQNAETVINNPNASDLETKINQFKVTALRYIPTKAIKLNGGIQADVLDIQAYSLNVFISDYLEALRKTSQANRKNVVMVFVNATRKYPLFDDKDRETTEAFVKDPGGFTPFSINVNWEKALEEEQAALKK